MVLTSVVAVEHKGLGYMQNRRILGADQGLSVDPARHADLIIALISYLSKEKKDGFRGRARQHSFLFLFCSTPPPFCSNRESETLPAEACLHVPITEIYRSTPVTSDSGRVLPHPFFFQIVFCSLVYISHQQPHPLMLLEE